VERVGRVARWRRALQGCVEGLCNVSREGTGGGSCQSHLNQTAKQVTLRSARLAHCDTSYQDGCENGVRTAADVAQASLRLRVGNIVS
jgi:hypothetical protein